MIHPAFSLFLLRELSFSRFDFPRWQSVLAVTLIGLLAGMQSAQAYASEAQVQAVIQPAQPVAAFSEADINALFVTADKPMQLAALSQQEMRETEGAWVHVPAWVLWRGGTGAFIGGSSAFAMGWNNGQRGWQLVRTTAIGAGAGAASMIAGGWLSRTGR